MIRKHVLGVAAAAMVAGWGLSAAAVDEPANIIKYRQATMSAIGAHLSMLAMLAKNEVSFMDEAAGHAHAINEMSKNLARLFPAGSGQGDTDVKSDALAVIWEKPEEFQAAIVAFQTESQKMVEVTETDDRAAFARQLGALGKQGCGNCHDNFRAEN
jgi:cytochrome c556